MSAPRGGAAGLTGGDGPERDAIVVGAGPNGLAAAITIAREGRSVLVVEAAPTIGGGARSAELTLPGFVHDICSAIHPLVPGSPFMSELPLKRHGLELVHPPAPLAHPFDGGRAAMLERSVAETAAGLGAGDGEAYRSLMEPLVADAERLMPQLLAPLSVPRHPLALARFGRDALRSASAMARGHFEGEPARGLFAGMAAHSLLPLEAAASAAFGLVLGLAGHAVGWPLPRGGSQRIVDAMAAHLRELGGEIECGRPVGSLDELPPARAVLCDVSPRGLLEIAGSRLPERYRRGLERFRHGPGAFKLDWALDGPIPWQAEECARAATVHLGGTLGEIAASERAVDRGEPPERPYVLLAQQSLFDDTRAPPGKHTAWAYCHVPNGSGFDMTERIEAQIERFAPGFRDLVLERATTTPAGLERYNANYVGGDINGGRQDVRQLFTRPLARPVPYRTPLDGLYLCSASTPPGGGVHGMCGWLAAKAALTREFR
ncbi:MAG: Phytoene dehydrogenase and related proteins [uncultured Solirubrobacterales bacterium]|uniref:Phytoene dehydrogenase and related proteins n=1 Tax=uncultured Solirubrobacterales bacterium TaxID=768556 RepID=A0A6J4RYP9_9ACTN|nr:MAG: Phytoene dehydrogenase and related proteins [uncultured Solirubrobacterales bacterium]